MKKLLIGILTVASSLSLFAQAATEMQQSKPKLKPNFNRAGILERSDILTNGREWTLVPKNAIIYTPEYHKAKVAPTPKGTFVAWDKFVINNRNWIHAFPVDWSTAAGEDKISPAKIKQLKTLGKIVVSTHGNSPVSTDPKALEPDTEN